MSTPALDHEARAALLTEQLERERRAHTAEDIARAMAARGTPDVEAARAAEALLAGDPPRFRFTATGEFVATFAHRAELRGRAAVDQLANAAYSATPAGVYLAPSGFDAAGYRFTAGRPGGVPPGVTRGAGAPPGGLHLSGNTINITVPDGTPRDQARAIVKELETFSVEQFGTPTQWGNVNVGAA